MLYLTLFAIKDGRSSYLYVNMLLTGLRMNKFSTIFLTVYYLVLILIKSLFRNNTITINYNKILTVKGQINIL